MTFPVVNTGHVRLGGVLWHSTLQQHGGAQPIHDIKCGASMGRLPVRNISYRRGHTEFTIIQVENNGAYPTLMYKYADEASSIGDAVNEMAVCLATQNLPDNVTTAQPHAPGFLFIGVVGGVVQYRSISCEDFTTLDTGTVWDDELGVAQDQLRLVDLPLDYPSSGGGPFIVTVGPGPIDGQDTIYVRRVGLTPSSATATQVVLDLRPAENLTVDLTRMHVIGHDDQTITVYYKVTDASVGFEGTAVFAFNANDPSNIVLRPAVLTGDAYPVASNAGALRHPVTNQIVLAMEDSSADVGKQIFWYSTRGKGVILDAVPLIWDSVTHPHIFGGRWELVAPDQTIKIMGMGWADGSAGGGFKVIAGHQIGAIPTAYRDFGNTFASSLNNNAEAFRPVIGELGIVPIDGEAGAHGSFKWLNANSAPMHANELNRRGYDTETDFMAALLYANMNDVEGTSILSIIGPSGDPSDVNSAPGVTNGAQAFTQNDSSIEFDNGILFDTDFVSASAWVYPEISSSAAVRAVFGHAPAWQISWDETNQRFQVDYETAADGALSFTSDAALTPIAEDRWYHVTFTYDGTTAKLFLFGVLVGEDTPATGGPLDHGAGGLSVFCGYNGTVDSFRGRLDEVVVGSAALTPQEVMHNFVLSMAASDAPVMSSHHLEQPDRIVQCCIATDTDPADRTGPTYTLALRQTDYGVQAELANHMVIDVWRRDRGSNPVYLGPLPSPPELNDVVNSGSAGFGYNPTMYATVGTSRWESKVFYDNGTVVAFIALTDNSNDAPNIFRYEFDIGDIIGTLTITRVCSLDTDRPGYGSEVVYDEATDEYFVIVPAGDANFTNGTFFVIREADYGLTAFATAPSIPFADVLPAVTETHDGVVWDADFAGVTLCEPDGIVARVITAGMGFPAANVGDIQIIFGIHSSGQGALSDAVLVGTATAVLDRADIDSGAIPIGMGSGTLPVQLDEYGHGGVEPFAPIRWLQNPGGPTGDTLILAIYGSRDFSEVFRGDGGLSILRLKREAYWSVRLVCPVPFVTTLDGAKRHGADVAFSVDPNFESQYTLSIVRPYPDARERVSSTIMSSLEASDGGWTIPTPMTVNSIVRSSQQFLTAVWTDYIVQTRHFTDKPTGPRFVDGALNRVMPIIRWSATGQPRPLPSPYTYDNIDFRDELHAALQGGTYSRGNRLSRFWTVDGRSLAPMAGGKQFRIRGSGNIRRQEFVSLGTIRAPFSEDRVAPVGIIDDLSAEMGRYIFLTYDEDDAVPAAIRSFDSAYNDELNPADSSVTLWTIPMTLADDIHKTMRVVLVNEKLVLYFIINSSSLYFVVLPAVGVAAITDSPVFIKTLDMSVEDRFYAVTCPDDENVVLYFGDSDSTTARRTVALVHRPLVFTAASTQPQGEIVRDEKTVFTGSSPFPHSYAACVGRSRDNIDQILAMMEPVQSRDGGGYLSQNADPLLGEFSGNSWDLLAFTKDGYFFLDQVNMDQETLTPFMGGSHAAHEGGRNKVRTRPMMLARVVDDAAADDISTEYVMHLAVKEGSARPSPISTDRIFAPDLDSLLDFTSGITGADGGSSVYEYDFRSRLVGETDDLTWASIQDMEDEPITVSMWIHADAIGADVLFGIEDQALGDAYRFLFSGPGALSFIHDWSVTDTVRTSAIGVVAVDSWYHVAVTYAGNGIATDIHIYVNGHEVTYATTTAGAGTARAPDGVWRVGNDASAGNGFEGRIAKVEVWNRILSPEEIFSVYRHRYGFGDNILFASSSPFEMQPQSYPDDKSEYAYLIPGSLHIEPIGGVKKGENFYSLIQGVGNRLDAWALSDAESASGLSDVGQDQVHGVKCFAYGPGKILIVGWGVAGE